MGVRGAAVTHLVVLQGERGANQLAFEQLRRVRAALPDARITLVRARVAFWQWDLAELSRCVDHVLAVDPLDVAAVRAAVGAGARPTGVLTFNEDCLDAAADLAARHGLTFSAPEAVARCRDKRALRHALEAAGVSVPRWREVDDEPSAVRAAEDIGYPVVLKPPRAAGSVGVVTAETPRELGRAWAIARRARWGGGGGESVLVESLVGGATRTANLYVEGGEIRFLCGSEKRTRAAPFFLTSEDRMAPEWDAVEALAIEATRAMGLGDGLVHVEIAGDAVLEVTPRLGGGYLGAMIEARTGLEPVELAARLAVGRAAGPTPGGAAAVVGRYAFAPAPGRLSRCDAPAGDLGVHWYRTLADHVGAPPSDWFPAVAHLVAAAETLDACRARLDRAESEMGLEVSPALHPRVGLAWMSRLTSPVMRRRLWSRLAARRAG